MFARNASVLFGVAAIAVAVTPPVKADQWDKKTVITINEPVQMPSCCKAEHVVVLQPGTYVLALVDSLSDRHIVRVFEQDQRDRDYNHTGHPEPPPPLQLNQKLMKVAPVLRRDL